MFAEFNKIEETKDETVKVIKFNRVIKNIVMNVVGEVAEFVSTRTLDVTASS